MKPLADAARLSEERYAYGDYRSWPEGARGAPDLALEILSPSTSKKDLNEKFNLFERSGVREYWGVDPGNRSVQVWRLGEGGKYGEGELRDAIRGYSPISSSVLQGFPLDPAELFAEME